MKLHHTEYKKRYKKYILSSVSKEMRENGIKKTNDNSVISYLFNRFNKEYGWKLRQEYHLISGKGKQEVMSEWLSGLAINIPCYNGDVIDLAIKMGSIDKNPSDKLIDRVVANYFNFMANIILSLEPKRKNN